jgi:hypothetical protein
VVSKSILEKKWLCRSEADNKGGVKVGIFGAVRKISYWYCRWLARIYGLELSTRANSLL